jgi:glycosyltransferase involved in cell wall biosynthesis
VVDQSKPGCGMKLLIVGPANSVHCRKWVSYFRERDDMEVRWISYEPSELDDPPSYVPSAPSRLVRMVSTCAAIRRAVRDFVPDVVQVHSVARYGLLSLAVRGAPLVLTPWGSDVIFAGRWRRILLRYVLSRATALTVDARHMTTRLTELGAPRGVIHEINFGIDTHRFVADSRDHVVSHPFTILSTRNLEPVYDIPTLVRAVARATAELPSIRLIIVGSGSQEAAIRTLCDELGLGERVSFRGRVANDSLPQLYRSADMYVSTSLSDAGIAASTAEAMSSGIPVAVSDTGENSDWVQDGVNGYLFPAGDDERLSQTIARVHGMDDTSRRRLGEAARTTICERNDYRNEMAKVLALYRSLSLASRR